MSGFVTMQIPVEADGMVDDKDAFEEQQSKNEHLLKDEITNSQEDDLAMGDYEDINGSLVENRKYTDEALAKLRDRILKNGIGRRAILGRQ